MCALQFMNNGIQHHAENMHNLKIKQSFLALKQSVWDIVSKLQINGISLPRELKMQN